MLIVLDDCETVISCHPRKRPPLRAIAAMNVRASAHEPPGGGACYSQALMPREYFRAQPHEQSGPVLDHVCPDLETNTGQ